jgi:hypothetical protein
MNSNCLLPFYHFLKKKDCINSDICQNFCDDDKDICSDCSALFGKWRNGPTILRKVNITQTCPLCLTENTQCYYRPSCNHFLCVQCFQKFLFGIQPLKPTFPYKNNKIESITDIQLQNDITIQIYLNDLAKYNDYITKTSKFTAKCNQCLE